MTTSPKAFWIHAQRFTSYADLGFTDEEVVTVYLAGILDKKREIRTIHNHARDYWADWFPHPLVTGPMCGA